MTFPIAKYKEALREKVREFRRQPNKPFHLDWFECQIDDEPVVLIDVFSDDKGRTVGQVVRYDAPNLMPVIPTPVPVTNNGVYLHYNFGELSAGDVCESLTKLLGGTAQKIATTENLAEMFLFLDEYVFHE